MSRLGKDVQKPFTKTLSWKNDKYEKNKDTKKMELVTPKGWYYYQKFENPEEGQPKGENILMPSPLVFVWLLSGTSFSGYNEASGKSVFSNEVLSTRDTKSLFPRESGESQEDYEERIKGYMTLKAKLGDEVIAEGLYKEIKPEVGTKGGKYCQPVYALVQTDEGTEIMRILMKGSSAETWMGFFKEFNAKDNAISCNETIEKSKGSNDYEAPIFKYIPASKELLKEADKAAEKVLEYFKYILNKEEESFAPTASESEDFTS